MRLRALICLVLSPWANAYAISTLVYYRRLIDQRNEAIARLEANLLTKDALIGDLHRIIHTLRGSTR